MRVLERSLIEQRSTLALCPEKLSRNNTQLRLDTLKFSLTFTKKVWNMSEVIHPFLEALQEMQGGSLFRSCLMEEKARGCKYWLTTSMANRVSSIAAVRSTVIRFLDILAPALSASSPIKVFLPVCSQTSRSHQRSAHQRADTATGSQTGC